MPKSRRPFESAYEQAKNISLPKLAKVVARFNERLTLLVKIAQPFRLDGISESGQGYIQAFNETMHSLSGSSKPEDRVLYARALYNYHFSTQRSQSEQNSRVEYFRKKVAHTVKDILEADKVTPQEMRNITFFPEV